MPDSNGGRPTVTLYSRPGCHLCADAREVVARVCAEADTHWQEVNITDDAELERRYRDSVPVTVVRGRQLDFWRVDEARLRAALGSG